MIDHANISRIEVSDVILSSKITSIVATPILKLATPILK